jgi:hypothetical protein
MVNHSSITLTSLPYRMMGTTRESKNFSRRLQGLFRIVNSPNTLVNKIYINTEKNNKWVTTIKEWINKLELDILTLTQIIVNFILLVFNKGFKIRLNRI